MRSRPRRLLLRRLAEQHPDNAAFMRPSISAWSTSMRTDSRRYRRRRRYRRMRCAGEFGMPAALFCKALLSIVALLIASALVSDNALCKTIVPSFPFVTERQIQIWRMFGHAPSRGSHFPVSVPWPMRSAMVGSHRIAPAQLVYIVPVGADLGRNLDLDDALI
jgi:hypothetical protein